MKASKSSDVSEVIGDASNWFSIIELIVVDVTASIINSDDPRVGEIVCDSLSLSQTLSLLSILVEYKRPNIKNKVAAATKALRTCSTKRNDLLHSVWIYVDNVERVAQLRPRKRHMKSTPHSYSSLHTHVEAFIEELRPVYDAWCGILNQLEIEKKKTSA